MNGWLQENKHRIEVHYLPSYSPELNPDVSTTNGRTLNRRAKQYLNNDLKQNLSRQGVPSNQSQLEDRVSGLMKLLKKRPKKIRSFFRHPQVR